jgi:hypothetical protein
MDGKITSSFAVNTVTLDTNTLGDGKSANKPNFLTLSGDTDSALSLSTWIIKTTTFENNF